MSNPFDEDNGVILEGFLCPICREDLKSLEFLTDHVEKVHAEEQDALKSIFKDIFSKAKRKIKFNFDDSIDLAKSLDRNIRISNTTTHGNVFNYMVQSIGAERSHLSYFNSVRNPRLERYASETNKLIIRLHKLLKDMPAEPVLRKTHEQNIVPWLDGSSVKLCPNCAKSFHIARRQHHCRLCGSIMCNDCSKFLPLDNALELASLTMSRTEPIPKAKDERLNNIRTCDHCLWLLETRKEMHDSRTCRPPISVIYDEIQQLKKNILPDIDMYLKIIDSLYGGDSIFTIADASALRAKIGQVAETVDIKSKKILLLPCQEGSREEAMKKAVRLSCVQLIKEKMLSIPPLPVEAEIKKIQDKKRMETEQRIETERRLALEAYEKYGLAESNDSFAGNESYASGANDQSISMDIALNQSLPPPSTIGISRKRRATPASTATSAASTATSAASTATSVASTVTSAASTATSPASTATAPASSTPSTSSSKTKKKITTQGLSGPQSSPPKRDKHATFGEFVASELRALSPRESDALRMALMRTVMTCLENHQPAASQPQQQSPWPRSTASTSTAPTQGCLCACSCSVFRYAPSPRRANDQFVQPTYVRDFEINQSALRTLDNWSAYQLSTSGVASNDPLVEQINIIKGYIKQARRAMRFDEVATLEMNLRELQREFYMRHQTGNNDSTTE